MRRVVCATFLLVSLCSCDSRSQGHLLFISPFTSYDSFRSLGFSHGFDFGASAGVRLTPSLTFVADLGFGARTEPFDLIGGSDRLDLRLTIYEATLEQLLFGRPDAVAADLLIGGGGISSSVDGHTVSLGALGSVTVPPRSDNAGYLIAGLRGVCPLTPDAALTIAPMIRIFRPFTESTTDISISGGVRVGLF
jgi:hypothetical protein